MGIPPTEVRIMTMWEYMARLDGWNRSQKGGHKVEGGPMSDADYDALCQIGEAWNG